MQLIILQLFKDISYWEAQEEQMFLLDFTTPKHSFMLPFSLSLLFVVGLKSNLPEKEIQTESIQVSLQNFEKIL